MNAVCCRPLIGGLFLSILLFGPWLNAAPPAVGEITVTDIAESTAIDAPSSFTTVIVPTTEEKKSTTLPELLSKKSGAVISSTGSAGHYSTVSIRGSSAEQVLILLDGIRLNSGARGAVDISLIPMEMIERIEIVRGGGTTDFGGDAIGGVINIITKEAAVGRHLEASLSGGLFWTGKGTVGYSEKQKKWSLVTALSHFQTKGNYTFQSASNALSGGTIITPSTTFHRLHNRSSSDDLLLKWNRTLENSVTLELSNQLTYANRYLPGAEEETTQLYPANPLEAKEWLLHNTTHGALRFNELFSGANALELGANYRYSGDDFSDPSPAIGTPITVRTHDRELNTYVRFESSLTHQYIEQFITTRFDFRKNEFSGNGSHHRFTNSLSLKDEISLFKNTLVLLPAIRYEDSNDFTDHLDWKMGIIEKPVHWLKLKANTETTHRLPNFNELYFPDQGYLRGNANLKKEKSLNWDAGFEITPPKSRFEAAYFQHRIDNSILFVPVSAFTVQPINTYNVLADGIELSLSAYPCRYFDIDSTYTFTRARFKSSNLLLPSRPKHKAVVSPRFHAFEHQREWIASASVEHTGDIPIDTSNTIFIAKRTTLDFGLKLKWHPHYFIAADCKNITNIQLYDSRGFPLPRRYFLVTIGGDWS